MRVKFIDTDGTEYVVEGTAGESVMHCATHHKVPGIIGECGGAMACATCHGYVAEPWASLLPPPSAQEQQMISGCLDVRATSRLTCQIRLSDALDGLTIEVPQSQI